MQFLILTFLRVLTNKGGEHYKVNHQLPKRTFIPQQLDVNDWQAIKPFCNALLIREINSADELVQWLQDENELECAIIENLQWLSIKTTCNTNDKQLQTAHHHALKNVWQPYQKLKKKIENKWLSSVHCKKLGKAYQPAIRYAKKQVEIFRQKNVALLLRDEIKSKEFDATTGRQTIEYEGKKISIAQANALLQNPDRNIREAIYRKTTERILSDIGSLDALLSKLITLRHRIAVNAGFKNYVEYVFAEKGRFDYTPADYKNFHNAVALCVMPVYERLMQFRKTALKADTLHPWDLSVNIFNNELKPINDSNDLVEKSIKCFSRLDPCFGECLIAIKKMNRFDLDARTGKRNGGYLMGLAETVVPFIFMNNSNTFRDVITMLHEGGHAVHSFLSANQPNYRLRVHSPELGELASMGMEQFSKAHWDIFFSDENDLSAAVHLHTERCIDVLPNVCKADAFQYWLYENPEHTIEERRNYWSALSEIFIPSTLNREEFELRYATSYLQIPHLFHSPFYMIEYAFCQLGALALWRNFNNNPDETLAQYKAALCLANTATLPEFYRTAGIRFDFSDDYVKEIMAFVEEEFSELSR